MQEFTAPLNTNYKIECWGANGHGDIGRGAYTNGNIFFPAASTFYIYVGQMGVNGLQIHDESYANITSGTFNGGGGFLCPNPDSNNATGGGATDIRLQSGNWDDFSSLKSRIMVAAGGGAFIVGGNQSYGGTLSSLGEAENHYPTGGHTTISQGASQTSGYKFGIGQDGGRAGGGGGYYGGCSHVNEGGLVGLRGSGGSSFISGYTGCNAISGSSTEDNIIHTDQPNHYSGYVFTNSVMIDGGSVMPSPSGGTETGHGGNGYCIITWQQLP